MKTRETFTSATMKGKELKKKNKKTKKNNHTLVLASYDWFRENVRIALIP